MKQKLLLKTMLLLCILVGGASNVWATDVTFTAGTDKSATSSLTKSDITLSVSSGTFNRDDNYRVYANNTLTVSSSSGNISKIVFTYDQNTLTLKSGEAGSITSGTWTGDANSVTFNTSGGQVRLSKVVVTYASGGGSTCATPSFSPSAGAVAYNTSVSISCATVDATIYYTTDNSTPTTESSTYSSAIAITSATTIKAIAVKDGLTNSSVGSASYTIAAPSAPTFSVPSGSIAAGTKVTITGTGTIRYTTNGVDPTSSTGTVYSEPVSIDANCTLKAICVDGGGNTSSVTSANYGVVTPVAGYNVDFESAPVAYTDWTMTNVAQGTTTITAHGGTYYGTTGGKASASIVTAEKVAKPETLTFYVSRTTTNSTSSTWYVEVSSNGSDWTSLTSQSATSMPAGTWTKVQCDIKNALEVYYTDVYVRIRYAGSTAVRTIDDISLTEVMPVKTPTFSVDAGSYTSIQSVTISCETDGATIYYTLDGSTPTSSSTLYSSALSISESCTLKAIAIKGDDESNIASATYTINLPTDYNLATSITSGKHYVIASSKADGTINIMNTQAENNRGVKSATISSGVLQATGAREFVIQGPDADGLYTIFDGVQSGYLYAASSGSNHLKTQANVDNNARWEIAIDGESKVASIVAKNSSNRKVMQYNSSSTIFSCYGSASQSDVYLFEKDGEADPTESVTIGSSGFAAYCSANALDLSGVSGIKAYMAKVNTSYASLTEIEDGIVPAREGVILAGSANTYNIPVATALGSDYDAAENEMVGVTSRTQVLWNPSTNVYNYILQQGSFKKASDGYLKANRAYLSTSYDVSAAGARELQIVFDDETTAIRTVDKSQELNANCIYDLQGRKVMNPVKGGLYIVNGKKTIIR